MGAVSLVRTTLVGVGLLSFAAGLVLVTSSTAATTIRWPWSDELLLVSIFTLCFLLATSLIPFGVFPLQDPSETEPTAPGQVPPTPAPGRDVERVVDSRWPASLPRHRRRRLRQRMRETIVRTLVRRTDCDETTAEAMIANGTWTDDPIAAAFVRTDSERTETRLESMTDRLRFTRRLRRTVQAVLALEDREVDGR
ncbi:uncharacterized protein Nmag_2560 [Natrialba magadii ATCC 43099]|uniref:Uncharacterized protein n=1 Tax=Natrialba magadii (strain ATCC 43099 / DSM 3394 / CCM 3739 / CIP 104546 / IAM 13178 / JCM 8861 / NBRC 102185 / NCIMB 2190 / MS3) TaxID=547559 RepID=D3SYE9_NATMM|nr:hypothetical protein [Natrialba magadii]ADD06120.1 uncharacterized protein Nmag_2560 [Natrialba magadii ATCC 43099]ELY30883.1 hypothetical protein C500_07593 [Natrialba magadii ATCC 43099]